MACFIAGCAPIDKGYWDGTEGRVFSREHLFSDSSFSEEYFRGYAWGFNLYNRQSNIVTKIKWYFKLIKNELSNKPDTGKTHKPGSRAYIEYTDKEGETRVMETEN